MHVLFIVHGMGEHNETWAESVKEKLIDCSEKYNWFSQNSLTDRVEFCPLRYDNLFDQYIDNWKEDLQVITQANVSDGFIPSDFADWIGTLDDDERNFFWTHLADVIIYRFLPFERARIQIELIRDIARKIKEYVDEYEGQNVKFSFLAHSLGTCVIHDSLHKMGTTDWDDEIDNVFGPQHRRLDSIFMLANTSRILKNDIEPMNSIVRPISSDPIRNNTFFDRYYNFYHKFDPVNLLWRFNATDWNNGYLNIELSHFRELNIHSYEHFLVHPKVHIPILKRLVYSFVITNQEKNNSIENFRDISPEEFDEDDANRIKEKIEELRNQLDDEFSLTEFIKQWLKFRELIRKNN